MIRRKRSGKRNRAPASGRQWGQTHLYGRGMR